MSPREISYGGPGNIFRERGKVIIGSVAIDWDLTEQECLRIDGAIWMKERLIRINGEQFTVNGHCRYKVKTSKKEEK